MPKGGKRKNDEEVLGQIFDFIFQQAKKPANKRKPIKVKYTGISTPGALSDGIAAALEKPGLFVTDQLLSTLNDALTVELGRMNADEAGDNKAKITTSTLVDFFKDPDAFLSKPKLAARKSIMSYAKAGFMGRIHEELVANAWAHKYDLDLDAKKAIRGHFVAKDLESTEAAKAFSTSAGMHISTDKMDSRKGYIMSRGATLVGQQMFGREGWSMMSDDRKKALQKAFIRGNDAVKQYINDTYPKARTEVKDRLMARYEELLKWTKAGEEGKPKPATLGGKTVFGNAAGLDLTDLGIYRKLEVNNIGSRIDEMKMYLRRNPGLSPNEIAKIEQGIENLGKAEVLVSGAILGSEDFKNRSVLINKRIKDFNSELADARKAGDKKAIQEITERIKTLKESKRDLNRVKLWQGIASLDGKLSSWKGVMGGAGGENFLLSVLNGSFYDPNSNSFALPNNPNGQTIEYGKYSWQMKDETGKMVPREQSSKINIIVAQENKKNKLVNAYNQFMVDAYYLTPKSILKTIFVNGEGFAYVAYKNAMKASKILESFDLQRFDAKEIASLLACDDAEWTRLFGKGIGSKDYKKYQRIMKRVKLFSKMGKIFSFAQRQRDKIKNWMDDMVFRKLRQGLYNRLVKRLVDKEALALLERWLAKGGFEVLAKALVTNILTALGIGVTGGLGSFLAPILSAIVTDILYDTAKVVIQFILIIIAGVVGLFWFGLDSSKASYDAQTYAYTNYTPGEIYYNPNFTGDISLPGGVPGVPGTIYTGSIQQIYDQLSREMGIGTELRLVTCTSGDDGEDEGPCNLIGDWAWCYSGVQIYCKADKMASAGDQTASNLLRHELVHQIQAGGSSLLREWGADYLSNNGGGYRFRTRDGTKRGTEIGSYLLSTRVCTTSDLSALAVNPSIGGACGNLLRSYVEDFVFN